MNEHAGLWPALIAARKAIILTADKKGLRNSYASLGAVMDAVTDPLFDNGLYLKHEEEYLNDDVTILITSITHVKTKETTQTKHPMVSKGFLLKNAELNGKSLDQEYGSQLTYSKRYSIQNLLGLVSENDTDPDSNQYKTPQYKKDTSEKQRISAEDAAKLNQALIGYPRLKAKLLEECKSKDGTFNNLFLFLLKGFQDRIREVHATKKDID